MTTYFVQDTETGEPLGPTFDNLAEAEEEAKAWRSIGQHCEVVEA